MTPDQIKLNMAVMTPKGKGVVVGWTEPDIAPYLVKLEKGGRDSGGGFSLIAGSRETIDNDGFWFSSETLTAIEDYMTEQTHYSDWEKLTELPDEPRPDEKVGAKFVVVKADHGYFELGDIVELAENDWTRAPFFTRINKNERIACAINRLAPLPEQSIDNVSNDTKLNLIESCGLTSKEFIETVRKGNNLTYKEFKRENECVRSYNVGNSDYAKHKIQPWDVWLNHSLNPWEGDIVKRVIRRKKGQNRREDFEKIIHIAQELIRQIDMGEYVDYKLMAEENKELKKRIEELENENKNNNR